MGLTVSLTVRFKGRTLFRIQKILAKIVNNCLPFLDKTVTILAIEGVLEVVQPNEEPDRQARPTEVLDIQGTEFCVKERPINGVRQPVERMLAVQDLIQPRAQLSMCNRTQGSRSEESGRLGRAGPSPGDPPSWCSNRGTRPCHARGDNSRADMTPGPFVGW